MGRWGDVILTVFMTSSYEIKHLEFVTTKLSAFGLVNMTTGGLGKRSKNIGDTNYELGGGQSTRTTVCLS